MFRGLEAHIRFGVSKKNRAMALQLVEKKFGVEGSKIENRLVIIFRRGCWWKGAYFWGLN